MYTCSRGSRANSPTARRGDDSIAKPFRAPLGRSMSATLAAGTPGGGEGGQNPENQLEKRLKVHRVHCWMLGRFEADARHDVPGKIHRPADRGGGAERLGDAPADQKRPSPRGE